jgi:hypothetical protein
MKNLIIFIIAFTLHTVISDDVSKIKRMIRGKQHVPYMYES